MIMTVDPEKRHRQSRLQPGKSQYILNRVARNYVVLKYVTGHTLLAIPII